MELQGSFEDLANSNLDFAQLFSSGKETVDEEELVSEFEDDKMLTPVERVLRQMSVVSNRSNRVSMEKLFIKCKVTIKWKDSFWREYRLLKMFRLQCFL